MLVHNAANFIEFCHDMERISFLVLTVPFNIVNDFIEFLVQFGLEFNLFSLEVVLDFQIPHFFICALTYEAELWAAAATL